MKHLETYRIFNGEQQIWQHFSDCLNCEMKFAIYLPNCAENSTAKTERLPVLYWLSGLTCTEQNFITKSGFQRYADEHNLIVVAPDTSPRGENVADDDAYDLGQGAGFYVNATQGEWAKHYQMYDYIVKELPALIDKHFPTNGKQSIFGHSMGGHGALMIAFKNPDVYQSVSAFSPIVAPSCVAWGQKAFSAYLGDDKNAWQDYDSVALLEKYRPNLPILIEQGDKDKFLAEQLKPELFCQMADKLGVAYQFNLRAGYDHSYYFISSFIGEHIAFHAKYLK
ncbi:S-formylglutathione hydrolase [Wielerella bovis]|uniref:S-formylglutathione hydrolase n=1 Tax=Wielerella bovis TaxID=2917790 RepID=UPI0020188A45|nr:S-formylglutathione hydrolase [Wielerella bovis]ULJ61933.1 S-formylglutathione hydrolase [Wielerella bovis]ULJ64119.1 S-formylglutathione hydrolase [Wielerella bovis]ULJ67966.1 S-formylglutathione hydrolase [Wielerella bovis]